MPQGHAWRLEGRVRGRRAEEAVKPLVVDLDGTLIRSDLLIECAFAAVGRGRKGLAGVGRACLRGKAGLKHFLAAEHVFDPAVLPYDEAVLAHVEAARAQGRPVYLASASNARLVEAVADHLGFDGWFASDETNNLSGAAKAEALVRAFGEQGFDYVGNDRVDLHVWARADEAVAIRAPAGVARRLNGLGRPVVHLEARKTGLMTWIKLLRIHQYAKNALVFVPLLTSHSFSPEALLMACLAVTAFSLCASSVYIVNDLVDLAADRGHPTKRNRPFASGSVPLIAGLLIAPLLLVAGLGVALAVSPLFAGVVATYLALTTAYTFYLKRKLMLDVVTLAMLYTIRVIGGAVAISVVTSPWLLAFCLFIFTSLALIKRYIELAARLDAGLEGPSNRNYRLSDLNVVMAIAAAAGVNAMTVLTLYLNSDDVNREYRNPEFLWLICPLLLYWIGRILIMAHRRDVDDDPVVFAIRDRISQLTVISMVVVVLFAI